MERHSTAEQPTRLLSDEQIEHILHDQIYPRYFESIMPPQQQPELIYIAGQPGSGKSWYESQVTNRLNQYEPNTAVSINCDDMRAYHPHFAELQSQDDISAAIQINPDNARFTDSLIDKSVETGCHVVLEGTFRNPDSVAMTAGKYREAGYNASAIVITTHPTLSRLGIIERYLDERDQTGAGRFTYSHLHDDTVAAMPDTVHRFIADQLGTSLTLVTRGGEQLYSVTTNGMTPEQIAQAATEAQQALVQEHRRKLTPGEQDLVSQSIVHSIERAQANGAPAIVIDELLALADTLDE